MRTTSTRTRGLSFLVTVVVLGAAAMPTSAAPAPRPLPPKAEVPSKTVKVEFVNTPWRKVFRWLIEETGKPVIFTNAPTGSFTYVGPPNKRYTIAEVVDILNEGLLNVNRAQPYELIQRQRSFTLVPADEQIDLTLLPRIHVEDLPAHGKSEYVSLVVPLGGLDADAILPYVKPMLGPGGMVVRVGGPCSDRLLFIDRAGHLRVIFNWIECANGSKW
jgi:hypothetical protein